MLCMWQGNSYGNIKNTKSILVIVLSLIDLVKKKCTDNTSETVRVLTQVTSISLEKFLNQMNIKGCFF